MLPQAVDFRAEADALHALLTTLTEADWERATLFKAWTVNDIVQHLHESDLNAAASVAGADPFARMRAETQALRDSGMTRVEATRHRFGPLTGKRLLERWYAQMAALCDALSALPADTRLKWAGPDMGVRMFTTARQMETWAHGQAIYDLMGVDRTATDRLRNIAEIGVRTYGWTFANRGIPAPGPAPHVRLTAPSGGIWEWNDPSDENKVEANALEFCQVVTQVRNVADTRLTATGEPARLWMSLAQCFAGPSENPPRPGARLSVAPGKETAMPNAPRPYPHPHVNQAWLNRRQEEILDPDMPIVDAHHHLWERPSNHYLLDELSADLGAGHNVVATVFIQCGYAYRPDGPAEFRPVGETERVASIAAQAAPGVCAGIVGRCDFRLGEPVDAVLEAYVAAGAGRFRGIRQSAGWDAAIVSTTSTVAPPGLLMDPAFRAGLARLGRFGLSYECSLYHPQLPELTDLARAFPDLPILANHCGGPIRIGPYADHPAEAFAGWQTGLRELATCPNVVLKLGGQAMTIRGFSWHEAPLPPSSEDLAAAWRPTMETCIAAFGASRCMFESNFPVDKGMCSYPVVWNAFKRLAAGCSAEERAALFHGTAARFYRLTLPG
jgi:L-fuconolactonase